MSNRVYQDILNELNRDVARENPTDVVQFCADWFQDRLRDERATVSRTSSPGSSLRRGKGQVNSYGSYDPNPGNLSPRAEQGPTDRDGPFSGAAAGAAAGVAGGAAAGAAAGGLFGSPFGGGAKGDDSSPHSDSGPSGGPFGGQGPFGLGAQTPSAPVGQPRDDEDDSQEEVPVPRYALGRRTSVSAESLVPQQKRQVDVLDSFAEGDEEEEEDEEPKPVSIPKTPEQLARIKNAIAPNFLFRNLDDEQEKDVLDAMKEVNVGPGETVIQQGDAGDYFYVVESGELEIFVDREGQELDPANGDKPGLGKKVATSRTGNSFGELALMHNAPRAATIVSLTPCTLWALDRVAFRTILLEHTSRKRRQYERFLSGVQILSSLKPAERAKIADVLESRAFEAGEDIIREGESGDEFYLIESGKAVATKIIDGKETAVKDYGEGDYFGELALLNNQTRAATVRATEKLRVATLGEQAFTRLLGPAKDIMARTAGERYNL